MRTNKKCGLGGCAYDEMEGAGERARRYVRLPEDCVSLCMENLGIQASRDVTSSLVEDVSFRIRQVTNVSGSREWRMSVHEACTYKELIHFSV